MRRGQRRPLDGAGLGKFCPAQVILTSLKRYLISRTNLRRFRAKAGAAFARPLAIFSQRRAALDRGPDPQSNYEAEKPVDGLVV